MYLGSGGGAAGSFEKDWKILVTILVGVMTAGDQDWTRCEKIPNAGNRMRRRKEPSSVILSNPESELEEMYKGRDIMLLRDWDTIFCQM